MSNPTSQRQFTTGQGIIRHLIESQCGSFAKSACELIANALDAQSTQIDIRIDAHGFSIQDDGIGIPTVALIEANFGEFGFDHEDGISRTHGKFGLGRGQVFCFAPTRWATHDHVMEVDIRQKGLSYGVSSGHPFQKGMRIEGAFYEPRNAQTLLSDQREIEELVKYAQVPITLNGQRIDMSGQKTRWTEETPQAYIKISDGWDLRVYSQGIFVRAYSRSQVGVSGVLVTKVGSPLQLNMARTDILQASCALWKQLRKQLQAMADTTVKAAKRRTTDSDRD